MKQLKNNPSFTLHDLTRVYYMILEEEIKSERARLGKKDNEKMKFNPNKPWSVKFGDQEISSKGK